MIEPSSIAKIAARFPLVEALTWKLSDNENSKFSRDRKTVQVGFYIPRDLLTHFSLNYFNTEPSCHGIKPFAAQSATSPTDEMSLALNVLSQCPKLISVNLSGSICVSSDVFRLPSSHQPELSAPKDSKDTTHIAWSKNQYFHATFNMIAPDGDWYFVNDPKDESDDESDENARDHVEQNHRPRDGDQDEDEDRCDPFDQHVHNYGIGSEG